MFPESAMLLMSLLDICKQGTTRVSVCLLASNDQDGKVKLKEDHLKAYPKMLIDKLSPACCLSDLKIQTLKLLLSPGRTDVRGS